VSSQDLGTPPPGGADPPADDPSSGRARALLVARRAVVVLVVGYVSYQLVREWPEVSRTLAQLPWPRVALSAAAVTGGVLLGPLVWHAMVDDLGAPVRVRDAARVYLIGQLGKYVPGSVVAVLLQMELGLAVGISRVRSFTASVLTAGIVVVTSLVAGLLAVPALVHNRPELLWLFVLLPIGLVLLHPRVLTWVVGLLLRLLRRNPLPHRLTWGAIARASGYSLLTFLLYGLHLYVLVGALPGQTRGGVSLLLCIGGIGLAMTAGLLAFVLPSGIGAREAVIVAALVQLVPYGPALAIAVVSRLLFTAAELLTAGVVALVTRSSTAPARG
jgi:glycosyltransferase 2 family protein